MKIILTILLLLFLIVQNFLIQIFANLNEFEEKIINFDLGTCENISESDIPTIFIPGILASWYSEHGYNETKVKRWIPDPITHSYDTLFYTFKQNGYTLRDVYYKNEFETYIDSVDKKESSFYVFGYDWKKDNKITAKLLSDLINSIRIEYEKANGCDIGTVNIVAHSMGGLIARSFLSDICSSDIDIKKYYENIKPGKLKNIKSNSCNNFTRVNNFVTISTPNRGSPNSFPIWTKGDISQTNMFIQSSVLKTQLGINYDLELYDIIHGYNEKIKNGIVTIGQLLPDIGNSGLFNDNLRYLYQKGDLINRKKHPQNTFLEELNKNKNIEKMFSNISGKYYMYYSTLTSNDKDLFGYGRTKNNIIGYNLLEKLYTDFGKKYEDISYKYNGKDIYDHFKKVPEYNVYNIKNNIINELGLGGDGTVPSNNLLLVENDSYNPGMYSDDKFSPEKISCFDENILNDGYSSLEEIEEQLSKKLGKLPLELCSHTKMPVLTSVRVFEKISGKRLRYIFGTNDVSIVKEQELLYSYIGYVDYSQNYTNTIYKQSIVGDLAVKSNYISGVSNDFKLDPLFEKKYINIFKDKEEINTFIQNKNNKDIDRVHLDFGSALDGVTRYEIQSPINLIIEDEQGRKIGIDPGTGLIINEIPGAWTSGNTEGSNEPEFFLIPKTGTGKLNHKITSYPTGEGEYHIVIQDFETQSGSLSQVGTNTIAGYAKEEIIEKYYIDISNGSINYIKDKKNLEEKYSELLEKIYKIIDEKYSDKQKEKLKNNLGKVIDSGNKNKKFSEKTFYLILEIFNYLNK